MKDSSSFPSTGTFTSSNSSPLISQVNHEDYRSIEDSNEQLAGIDEEIPDSYFFASDIWDAEWEEVKLYIESTGGPTEKPSMLVRRENSYGSPSFRNTKLPSLAKLQENNARSSRWQTFYIIFLASAGLSQGFYSHIANTFYFSSVSGDPSCDPEAWFKTNSWLPTSQFMFCIGAAIGSIFSGIFVNLVGRRKTMIIGELIILLNFVSYALCYYWVIVILYITRFMSGFAAGILFHTSIMMNIELAPRLVSGVSSVFITVAASAGTLVSQLCRSYDFFRFQDDENDRIRTHFHWQVWRLWLLVPAVLHIPRLCLILFYYKFDTPQFYMTKYGLEESMRRSLETLEIFYESNGKYKVLTYLMKEHIVKTSDGDVGLRGMFRKSYLPRLIAGIVFTIGCNLTGIEWNSFLIPIVVK
jgi:MFS family permease